MAKKKKRKNRKLTPHRLNVDERWERQQALEEGSDPSSSGRNVVDPGMSRRSAEEGGLPWQEDPWEPPPWEPWPPPPWPGPGPEPGRRGPGQGPGPGQGGPGPGPGPGPGGGGAPGPGPAGGGPPIPPMPGPTPTGAGPGVDADPGSVNFGPYGPIFQGGGGSLEEEAMRQEIMRDPELRADVLQAIQEAYERGEIDESMLQQGGAPMGQPMEPGAEPMQEIFPQETATGQAQQQQQPTVSTGSPFSSMAARPTDGGKPAWFDDLQNGFRTSVGPDPERRALEEAFLKQRRFMPGTSIAQRTGDTDGGGRE